MIINNKSDYAVTVILDNAKYAVDSGKSFELHLLNEQNEVKVYINRKPNIHFKLFPFFKATHFLEDHIELNLVFNLFFTVKKECKSLDIVNCSCRCEKSINLISVALDDYSDVTKASFFAPSYEQIKRKYLFYEVVFIFLLPWCILCGLLGLIFRDYKILFLSVLCLIISFVESAKLIKYVKNLTENEMIILLKQRAELIEQAKQKDFISQKIVKIIFDIT